MTAATAAVAAARDQLAEHLEEGIIPFWMSRGIDTECGGYLTCFDAEGRPTGDTDKSIVTQTRMIWGTSAFHRRYPDHPDLRLAARQGVDFFIDHFWDRAHGGWHWRTNRAGRTLDDGKVIYGQSFAIYALAEYTLATGDDRGLDYASRTFDLLQKHAADTLHGGYYENLERHGASRPPASPPATGVPLDIHMHLLEAFTTLATASGAEIHRRKLREVAGVILARMVSPTSGCGLNQFGIDFTPRPAIAIRRTWNADRKAGEAIDQPMDTTSYGHNLELAWLLHRAAEPLGESPSIFHAATRRLAEHALQYGLDPDYGGVYRDGPHIGPALVRDKEWWQNSEALVGWLDAYEQFADPRFAAAFVGNWEFDRKFFIHPQLGEWRQLLARDGAVIVGDLGNPWKACYHSGRSVLECVVRLDRLLAR